MIKEHSRGQWFLLSLGALALALAGCSSSPTATEMTTLTETTDSTQTEATPSPDSSATSTKFSSTDVMFAEMMIPHHEQAIEMSQLALERSQDPEVLALAQEILAAQGPEIEEMKSWGQLNLDMHQGHMMMGMLSEKQMSALAAVSGPAFDRLFLEGMIVHHQGAIQMAQMVLISNNARAVELGEQIVIGQNAEIKQMQEMLAAR